MIPLADALLFLEICEYFEGISHGHIYSLICGYLVPIYFTNISSKSIFIIVNFIFINSLRPFNVVKV